ncbi:MAG: ABC transporter permease subunit [Chloroflexi bacterium]|nr:ABC transporter permease subunit [Chloroflexota bacterium]
MLIPGIPDFLSGPSLALIVIMIYTTWTYIGYDTAVFLAGLGNSPADVYEAARIDGANAWQMFRRITLPLLSPTTFFLTLIAVIGTFQAFTQIWIMRTPAAQSSVDTIGVVIFETINATDPNMGYGSAMAFVLFAVVTLSSLWFRTVSPPGASSMAEHTADRRQPMTATGAGRVDTQRPRKPFPWGRIVIYAVLILGLFQAIFPLLWMLSASLMSLTEVTFGYLRRASCASATMPKRGRRPSSPSSCGTACASRSSPWPGRCSSASRPPMLSPVCTSSARTSFSPSCWPR